MAVLRGYFSTFLGFPRCLIARMINGIVIIAGLLVFSIIMILRWLFRADISEPVYLASDYDVTIAMERAKPNGYGRKWMG